jgi:septal ring factor EnvC (AmiA/AmiB activator)
MSDSQAKEAAELLLCYVDEDGEWCVFADASGTILHDPMCPNRYRPAAEALRVRDQQLMEADKELAEADEEMAQADKEIADLRAQLVTAQGEVNKLRTQLNQSNSDWPMRRRG